jgi:Ca-activated chloride channel family protein
VSYEDPLVGLGAGRRTLSIVSGSENQSLEPLLERFERRERVELEMTYLGSVDIMMELAKPEFAYDAVWPANGLWVSHQPGCAKAPGPTG